MGEIKLPDWMPPGAVADPAESLGLFKQAIAAAQGILEKKRSTLSDESKLKAWCKLAELHAGQQRTALDQLRPAQVRGMSARVNSDGSLQMDLYDGMTDDELDYRIEQERARIAELESGVIAVDRDAEATGGKQGIQLR